MRALTTRAAIDRFMITLGSAVRTPTRVYLVGGATAVVLGWRDTTIDIDLTFLPESDEVYRALSRLKDSLDVNIELAAPSDFIPPLPGWETRSRFIAMHGPVSFYHYDFYAQALAKIERGHTGDRVDVGAMLAHGLIRRSALMDHFESIAANLDRYPAIDRDAFRKAVTAVVEGGDPSAEV